MSLQAAQELLAKSKGYDVIYKEISVDTWHVVKTPKRGSLCYWEDSKCTPNSTLVQTDTKQFVMNPWYIFMCRKMNWMKLGKA